MLRFFYATLFCFIILPGCSKKSRYRQQLFSSFNPQGDFTQTKDNVAIKVRKLTAQDCNVIFGERGDWLASNKKESLIPIYLSVQNNSSENVIIDPRYITLHTEKSKHVIRFMQSNTVGRTVYNLTLGTVLTVAVFAATTIATFWILPHDPLAFIPAAIVGTIVGAVTATGSIVGSCVSGVKSAQTNRKMRRIIRATLLDRPVIVEPGKHHAALIFVRKSDFYDNFRISVFQQDSDEIDTQFLVRLT